MRRKRDPIPRAKEAWVWIGGTALLGLLGAAVVGAAVLLWENVDIRQLAPSLVEAPAGLPEPLPARAAAVDEGAFTAVLLHTERNRAFFPDTDYHDREVEAWRALLRGTGGDVRDADDAGDLASLTADDLLVLVEAPCLAPDELAAVRAHIAAGGSIVANWAVGARDAQCEWRGWQTLLELTEAEAAQELPVRDGLFMTVPGGIGLAAGLDPGTRIELNPDPAMAVRIPGPRVYWSDWALNPQPDEEGQGADVAALAARTPEGGRVSWYGMRLGQAATERDLVHLRRLISNGIRWSAGINSASVAPWPEAARAAMVLTLDVEDQPRNALDVAALFERENLPGTFFAVTQLVTEHGDLADALSRVGEVGSQTADHTPLAGLTAQDQAVRLRRSAADIERWVGVTPSGLRPPEEAFDSTTLFAWRVAGGEYLLARNEARSASPEIHSTREGPVVLLPRLLKDDYNLVVQDRTIRNERVGEAFVTGARKLRAIGGLAVVAGHTQIMQSGRRVEAFRTVADAARSEGDWWMARGEEVARWWSARAEMRITFEPADDTPVSPTLRPSGLPDLVVTSGERASAREAWIDIVLPSTRAPIIPLVDGRSVEFSETDWGMRVPVGGMGPGERRRIRLVSPGAPDIAAGG